ncbi:ISA1214-6 transposase, partial [mine drainage metagenome]
YVFEMQHPTETDWKKYEREYAERVRYVGRELNSLTGEAISSIRTEKSNLGKPQKLQLQQKVVTLLLKSIFEKHNRPMAGLLSLFGAFLGIDVSYKTVERLYSDELVQMALHNMFVLTIKRRCGRIIDTSG